MTENVKLQLCTEDIWQGTMEQITRLGIQPAELPEEALTQIYQVRPPQSNSLACMQTCAAVAKTPAVAPPCNSQPSHVKRSPGTAWLP